ncbi:MAG: rhomboid family intramembrane serine protease [Acidimicrobiales bacterium]
MSQASIGHHCPECLSQGNQQVYTPRNMPGRGLTIVVALMAVNAVAFLAQLGTQDEVTNRGLLWGPGVANGEWYRVITSAFLHGSLLHIGFNMYALWLLGNTLEEGIGKLRFSIVYLAGLLGGSFAVLAFDFGSPTLGASGAVLGLAGALAAVLWSRGISLTQTSLGFILALNLALPLLVGGISFWGHLGGIFAGFAAGWLLSWLPGRYGQSSQVAMMATVGLCVALVGGIVVAVRSGGLL